MSQPIKKQQIIGLFGEIAGSKLLRWLDPCCDAFCTDVSACGGGSPSLPFNSVQYNNNGAFFGDTLFTRDPVTNNTIIRKDYGGNELGGYTLSTNSGVFRVNTSTGESIGINAGKIGSLITGFINYEKPSTNTRGTLLFNENGNTLTWDADTTDTITTKLEQSQDILGLGAFSGSALTWTNTSSNIIEFIGVVNNGLNLSYSSDNGATFTKILISDLVTISNVPTYADDAAAGVGGLTTGNLYKTTTGGSTFLKIVP